ERREVDRDPADRLRRVDVHQHTELPAARDDLGDGLQRADLVVAPLDVDDRGGVVDVLHQFVGVDPAQVVDADRVAPGSDRAFAYDPTAHRGVFVDRGDDPLAGALVAQRTEVRGRDRLRRTRGEDDLTGAGADQAGELLAGRLERDPRHHAFVVDASR